ncbi:alpha/beta fold hydrolase [Gloeocapsa sp. PCC 73106]|uniref:alpha/beta fold hydrolase n=1 Tax=Gloeocapsa sp. PCC 73106 TaxID=102232 RepID=UPI0002AC4D7B|nr:alpha/beta hydrolase [Gloeocapsa sp. PCC 73106]ELR99301.1 hypothetical protein GLO73106DRAFT_00031510 [Gloeocapsa sp. PCC 73106]
MNIGFSFFCPVIDRPDLPLLIFLPGMDGTGLLLHKQVKGLQKFFNLRCLVIPPNDRSDWETLTNQVIFLIESEWRKLKRPEIYLCGESFGGCIALSVAINIPTLWKQLILVNPASSFSKCPWLSWGIHLTPWIPGFIYPYSNLALLPWLVSLERISPRERQALLIALKSVPGESVSWRMSLLQNFYVSREKLNHFTVPVLLIASGRDRLLPSVQECIYLSNQFPHAQLSVLPESGHACLLEQEVYLDKLISSCLPILAAT